MILMSFPSKNFARQLCWYSRIEGIKKYEICDLLGCYAALIGSYLLTFRVILSVRPSRIKQSKKNDIMQCANLHTIAASWCRRLNGRHTDSVVTWVSLRKERRLRIWFPPSEKHVTYVIKFSSFMLEKKLLCERDGLSSD